MDTITQAVLGAAVAEAGFANRLGRKAVWFGAACGLLPDLDVVTRVFGEWTSLVAHRGPSHSLIVLPLVAPLVGAIGWRWFGERRNLLVWMHLAFWALITHPLLDVFTTYGTQLLSPLSDARFAFDGVGIIDPIYTLPLAYAVWKKSPKVARYALGFGTAYLAMGAIVSSLVADRATSQLRAEGFEPAAVRGIVPLVFTPLRRVIARDAAGTIAVAWWSPFDDEPIAFDRVIPPDDPSYRAALASEEGQIFAWFADGYVHGEVDRSGDAVSVKLTDLRYGFFIAKTSSPFSATFEVSGDRVTKATRSGRPDVDFGAELNQGWVVLVGRSANEAKGPAVQPARTLR